MARYEKTNDRDPTYSLWHRSLDKALAMIDIDCCEYCDECARPLALVETAIDVGQQEKHAYVTANLARMAKIPAYVMLYKGETIAPVPAPDHQAKVGVIFGCRMQRIYHPTLGQDLRWRHFSVDELADWIRGLRAQHDCPRARQKAA